VTALVRTAKGVFDVVALAERIVDDCGYRRRDRQHQVDLIVAVILMMNQAVPDA
jgi:hypothetical protein